MIYAGCFRSPRSSEETLIAPRGAQRNVEIGLINLVEVAGI